MDNPKYKIISHRGNLSGPVPEQENTLEQIQKVLRTTEFDIEIDVREIDGNLFLGHDAPQEQISIGIILKNRAKLWIHCKNLGAYIALGKYRNFGAFSINFFFHDQDPCALTSQGWLWGFPNAEALNKEVEDHYIHVLPHEELMTPHGRFRATKMNKSIYKNICTDYPLNYE